MNKIKETFESHFHENSGIKLPDEALKTKKNRCIESSRVEYTNMLWKKGWKRVYGLLCS